MKTFSLKSTAVACAVMLSMVSTLPHLAAAQTSPAPADTTFAITAFNVSGDNPLAAGEAERVLAAFVRPNATLETLQKAANTLEETLRDKGFSLYRVVLPPQQITDTVALSIVSFKLGTVTIQGNKQYSDDNVRNSLYELQPGKTPNFKKLAVQTTIANENLGKQVQVALKESATPDTVDATVTVKETKPWQGSLTVNNAGTEATGRDRVTLAFGHSNLFDADHQLTGAYTTTTARADTVKQLGLSYRAPLYDSRSVLGLSFTKSDVVGSFGTFNSTGAGQTVGASYSYYFAPRQGYRSYFTASVDDKQFDVAQINGLPLVGQLLRRSRQISAGYVGRFESNTMAWSYNAELAANIPNAGNGNTLEAYRSEDPRITNNNWKALRAGGSYSTGLGGNWLLGVRGTAQYSPYAMIAGEQIGLGGAASVRGAAERPLAGDRGGVGSVELTSPEMTQGLRMLGFMDAGWLGNNAPNATTKPGRDQLRSVGLGLRYGAPSVALSADWGRIVTGSVVPTTLNSLSPQKGDQKLHLNLSARF
jgi:hemolysin activation/secretion protein